MNNCKNCGNPIQPGVMVCPACNTPVGPTPVPVQPTNPTPAPVAPVQQPVAPAPVQPMGPSPVPMGQPMMNQQPPKKNNAVLFAVIGIVVIAIGVGLVLLLSKDSGGSGGTETPPEEKKETPPEEKKETPPEEKNETVIACYMEEAGVGKETDYGYLTNGVITRLDGKLELYDQDSADLYCEQVKQNVTSPTVVSCSGKTITVSNIQGNALMGKTASEFRSYYQTQGWTCN